jgi:3-deoxy-D-manno-octulosonic-acid transferase
MSIPLRLYTAGLHALRPALPLLARGESKLARGIRGRRGVLERMEAWASESRDPARPLVWFHAPSVGEGLQAGAVAERLRAEHPEVQIVYTFFSPSAERFARRIPADFADYLPFDFPGAMGRALHALRPGVIAFNKTEVWPNLASEAARRGVRLALLSATLPPGSGRLSGLGRPLLAEAFGRLDRLGAIAAGDAERFGALGVPAERRVVMGDAHFDRVLQRAAAVDPAASPLLRPLHDPDRLTVVAGSTWAPDEERLLPAVARLRAAGTPLRAILAPHEPTPDHLRDTERRLDAHGFRHRRLAEVERGEGRGEWDALLVDRVGVLGELYALADIAHVGGGFGTAGLHSVLEPAAFGVPILFGPRHRNAREAGDLVEAGGAFAVPDGEALARRLEGAGGGRGSARGGGRGRPRLRGAWARRGGAGRGDHRGPAGGAVAGSPRRRTSGWTTTPARPTVVGSGAAEPPRTPLAGAPHPDDFP